ncbi:MAG TPA: squalene/phytoene synthase family protein [bacterium]|nr:squalene/phytoene synthase family protein [bacterium]
MNIQNGSLQKKTSFYYAMLLLPRDQRRALETLYRFCWAADEISDGAGARARKRKDLARFKAKLKACLAGRPPADPLFLGLAEVRRRFALSAEPLERILKGVERDLRPLRFKTFGELKAYARQVAGGPGLASMEIFGFKDKAHRLYAENLGLFLQIVNMVRDVKEDAQLGRQYLPDEDFRRFKLNPAALDPGDLSWPHFVDFQLSRAESFWEKAQAALSRRQRAALPTAEAIAAIYGRLKEKLRAHPGGILAGKTSLSLSEKLWAVAGALSRCAAWKGLF